MLWGMCGKYHGQRLEYDYKKHCQFDTACNIYIALVEMPIGYCDLGIARVDHFG